MHGQDHHPGQCGHGADEFPELVVFTQHADADRPFRVEIARFLGQGFKQLHVDAGGQRGLRDVHQQLVHFGLAGQLAEHGLQHVLHLGQLLLVGFQVGGFLLLVFKIGAQRQFLQFHPVKLRPLVLDDHVVADRAQGHQQQGQEGVANRRGGAAEIGKIGVAEIVQDHGAPPCDSSNSSNPISSSDLTAGLNVTRMLNSYGSTSLCGTAAVRTTFRSGCRNRSSFSRL